MFTASIKYGPKDSRIYIYLIVNMNNEVDYTMLILDPQSINWKSPITVSNVIKQFLLDNLYDYTKNTEIRKLFHISMERCHEPFISYLMSITPCFPRALNEIYRLSPEGAKMSFLSMFTDMRTLKGMMSGAVSQELYRHLREAEFTEINHIIRVYYQLKSDHHLPDYLRLNVASRRSMLDVHFSCTHKLASYLRDKGWKRKLTGVTVPHPIEQFIFHRATSISGIEDNKIACKAETINYLLVPPNRVSDLQDEEVTKRGQIMPYFGSSTSEKKTSSLISYPKTDRSLRAAQKLYRLKDWICAEEGTLGELILNLIFEV